MIILTTEEMLLQLIEGQKKINERLDTIYKRLEDVDQHIDEPMSIGASMWDCFSAIDERFEAIDERLEGIEKILDKFKQ